MDLKTEGRWDQLKGRVKSAWGDLTDDDLEHVDGDRDRLVGRIKEKTGEAVDAIEIKLDGLLEALKK